MKVVKKTDEYTIFQRRDKRHAVQDADGKAVNGDEKAKILSAEGLIKIPEPKVEPAEEAPAEETAEAEAPAEETAEAEAPAAEEAPAEEKAEALVEETPAEETKEESA